MTTDHSMIPKHNPYAPYCIKIGIDQTELRIDETCPACDENIKLMMLDPDVEVLAPPTHLGVINDH